MKLDHINIYGPMDLLREVRDFREFSIPEIDMTQLFVHAPAGIRVELNFPGEPAGAALEQRK